MTTTSGPRSWSVSRDNRRASGPRGPFVSCESDLQHCQPTRLQTEAEVFVQRERAAVLLLRVDHRARDTAALHPTQSVERERRTEAVVLAIGVDREPLEKAPHSRATRDRVPDDAVALIDDAEPARRGCAHRFFEAGLVES